MLECFYYLCYKETGECSCLGFGEEFARTGCGSFSSIKDASDRRYYIQYIEETTAPWNTIIHRFGGHYKENLGNDEENNTDIQ